jgi:hypothetical protein
MPFGVQTQRQIKGINFKNSSEILPKGNAVNLTAFVANGGRLRAANEWSRKTLANTVSDRWTWA